jgi:uncharacterized protein (TIRG00374 family)
LITFWLRALRWQILVDPFQKIPLLTLLRWQVGGLFISNLLPFRMGEFARAYWAGHKTSISKSTIFGTIVAERILDVSSLGVMTVMLLFAMGFGRPDGMLSRQNTSVALLFFLALFLIFKTLLSRQKAETPLSKLKALLPARVFSILEKLLTGLRIFTDWREAVKVAVLSPVIWSLDILSIAIVSRSVGLDLSWMQAGLVMSGLILGVMIPAAPGGAGTYEAGGVAALTLMGFEKTPSLSLILLLHAVQYIFTLLAGIPVLMIEGFNPRKLLDAAKQNRE